MNSVNAAVWEFIPFPAPVFVAPRHYIRSQSARGFYSCNRCNGLGKEGVKVGRRRGHMHSMTNAMSSS